MLSKFCMYNKKCLDTVSCWQVVKCIDWPICMTPPQITECVFHAVQLIPSS